MTITPFNIYFEHLALGVHQWGTHVFKVALTNTAPDPATNTVLADITQIAAGNGYTAGGSAIANIVVSRTDAVARADGDDVTFNATPADLPAFRWAVVYNDSVTTPAKPLIGFVDNGSPVIVPAGQPFTVIWDADGIARFEQKVVV